MLNSPIDIAIVAGTLLLLFGPKKLPELGKALGQGIGLFKKGLQDAQDEIKSSAHESNKISTPVSDPASKAAPAAKEEENSTSSRPV